MRAFLKARLARGHWLGLHLTAGIVVVLAALAVFAEIASQVLSHGPLAQLDAQLAQRLYAGDSPLLARWTLVFTNIHGTAGVLAMAAVLGLYLARRRDWPWVGALVLCVPGAMLLNVAVKNAFQRPRPRFDNPLVTLDSFAFPSGHTAAATALYGFVAVLWMARAKGWGLRLAIVPPALAMVVLVALSRLVVGVHYLSDVMAAFAQSTAWLALCLAAVASWQQRPGR